MKFRTVKYHITQAFESLLHNRLMTLAAIATVSACSFILILTMCLIFNIDYMLEQIEETVGITVYLGDELTDDEAEAIGSEIESMPHIKTVAYLSKEDALEKAKQDWGSESNQLDSLKDDNPLPRSFEITIDDLKNQESVINELEQLQISFEKKMIADRSEEVVSDDMIEQANRDIEREAESVANELYGAISADSAEVFSEESSSINELPVEVQTNEAEEKEQENEIESDGYKYRGIEKIRHAKEVSDMLMAISTNIHIVTIVLMLVMVAISIAIIMNTIKLTVFIRRNEINIMKYVGATDWFIRWPFVLEGVIIGFIGALIPFIICLFGYGQLYENYMTYLTLLSNIVEMKPTGQIFVSILPITLIFGSALGALGSITSIRKHLNV